MSLFPATFLRQSDPWVQNKSSTLIWLWREELGALLADGLPWGSTKRHPGDLLLLSMRGKWGGASSSLIKMKVEFLKVQDINYQTSPDSLSWVLMSLLEVRTWLNCQSGRTSVSSIPGCAWGSSRRTAAVQGCCHYQGSSLMTRQEYHIPEHWGTSPVPEPASWSCHPFSRFMVVQ